MKSTVQEMLARIPGPPSTRYPLGEPFATAFRHGTMSVELYTPRGRDLQTPHAQDELYIVATGRGEFSLAGERMTFGPGNVLFAPAGVEHRFENFTADFATRVVFYGPQGGEKNPPHP